jgi:anti-sigma factor RsiW
MTNCWSEGALRAWLDRELPAEDMKAVAAHLGECSVCDAACTELAARASRVFSMLETLGEADVAVKVRPMPLRTGSRWLWPGAAVALAAGLAIASFVVPKFQERPEPAPVARVLRPAPSVLPVPPVETIETAPVPAAHSAVARISPRKPTPKPAGDYFLALDDEPIESGVIMRVAIEPGNAQADIVFDPGGRARAIRLVSNKY